METPNLENVNIMASSHISPYPSPNTLRKDMSELNTKRHKNYFTLTLGLLPPKAQREDSNNLLLTYCSLGGLSLLNHDFSNDKNRPDYVDFIYSHLLPSGEGFRGGNPTHQLPQGSLGQSYDPATIPNTYAALCSLLMLHEDYTTRLDSEKIMKNIRRCQLDDGSFKSLVGVDGGPFGDGDLRQCFMAVGIRKMLGYDVVDGGSNDIDVDKLEEYVKSRKVYDGGLGDYESHAGYTFCALATLKLIDRLALEEWMDTVGWLCDRQIGYSQWNEPLLEYEFFDLNDQGGHNGRDNKFADTCYSFWSLGSLALLDQVSLVDSKQMEQYLLQMTQNGIIGGFGKTEEDDPDPYHSFLALCALSLIKYPSLQSLDLTLVITRDASNFLQSIVT